jgi:hypothetical protein
LQVGEGQREVAGMRAKCLQLVPICRTNRRHSWASRIDDRKRSGRAEMK